MKRLCSGGIWAAIFLIATLPAVGARRGSLEGRIRRLLAQSPIARTAFAGILVEDESGHRLVDINATHFFVPASNTKLFSTALALEKLGPGFTVTTRLEQRGKDLFLIGAGDANLSGRTIPYQYNSVPGPALSAIDDLAGQLAARGITSIEGDIVGDDSAFQFQPYAHGWAIDDVLNDDGPPASALVVNDNVLHVQVTAGSQGISPRVEFDPAVPLFQVSSAVITAEPRDIHVERFPNSAEVRVWGTIPVGSEPYREPIAVDDPARFAALALKTSLEKRGIAVRGGVRTRHWLTGEPAPPPEPESALLASRTSPPLIEDLRVTDKVSQNLHADLLLFTVAKAQGLPATRESGLTELTRFLGEAGIPPTQFRFSDGSGLSRLNLVTPEAVVRLLLYMWQSPHREQWVSLLPVNGVDGSLADRLMEPRYKGRTFAKTGGLTHVSALSGYARSRRGGERVFGIFLNNYAGNTADAHKLIDRICMLLLE